MVLQFTPPYYLIARILHHGIVDRGKIPGVYSLNTRGHIDHNQLISSNHNVTEAAAVWICIHSSRPDQNICNLNIKFFGFTEKGGEYTRSIKIYKFY